MLLEIMENEPYKIVLVGLLVGWYVCMSDVRSTPPTTQCLGLKFQVENNKGR